MGKPAAVGPDRDQAQSQPPRAGRGHLSAAVSRPHRDRPAGERPAGGLDGGFDRLHPRLARRSASRSASMLLSEPAIVAGIAKATLKPNPKRRLGRAGSTTTRGCATRSSGPIPTSSRTSTSACSSPADFRGRWPARERKWKTPNGKANFTVPQVRVRSAAPRRDGVYELMTMRADGQFNTTIYNEDDRFRGIQGSRYVVLMNPDDMAELRPQVGRYRHALDGGRRRRRTHA